MAIKEREKSLLEIAIELLKAKRKPQKLLNIVTEVMEMKGYRSQAAKEHTAQFILDFMQSGYFVYCGDDCWDLKERQPTSVIDKDGGDYEELFDDDEDVKKNELNDDMTPAYEETEDDLDDNDEETDDDDDDDDDEDDLERELGGLSDSDEDITELEINSDDDDDEDEDDGLTEDDFK